MNYDTIIEESAAAILSGKVILYPTDTIWGLGCDATNANAVERIYTLKERKKDKPFIILVSGIEMLKNFVNDIHPRIETLLFYNERPLTLIYKQAKNLPKISIAEDMSVGIRIVKDQFCIDLIEKVGKPITSTSANISTNPSPKLFSEVSTSVKNKVDFIVPYRQNEIDEKLPSVLATFNNEGELIVLRS
jgi:L-threonylcarbamoyladenylate synthase